MVAKDKFPNNYQKHRKLNDKRTPPRSVVDLRFFFCVAAQRMLPSAGVLQARNMRMSLAADEVRAVEHEDRDAIGPCEKRRRVCADALASRAKMALSGEGLRGLSTRWEMG